MIKPNYAVKALVPYRTEPEETVFPPSLFKRADLVITECYKSRKRTYVFLLLSFCIFSVVGIYYYTYVASGLTPITLYTPTADNGQITLNTLYLFRRLHLFAALFVFLSGFTVFGVPVSLLFIGTDAFLIGFTIRYALTLLLEKTSYAFVLLYFLCIALYAVIDLLLCCESVRYARYARGGTKEMLKARRFFGYTATAVIISAFDLLVTYIFILI